MMLSHHVWIPSHVPGTACNIPFLLNIPRTQSPPLSTLLASLPSLIPFHSIQTPSHSFLVCSHSSYLFSFFFSQGNEMPEDTTDYEALIRAVDAMDPDTFARTDIEALMAQYRR